MNYMNLPIYNCVIDENTDDETGVYAISFVDLPANEVDFVTLSANKNIYLNKDEKKQVLTGVVLKPEQLIFRQSPQMGDYYIKFTAEQIEKIAHKMMKTGVALYSTTHQHQTLLEGNYLTELWIVEDPQNDKSRALGFKDLPKGTLMCSYKVENKKYWTQEVMTGNVKGFSLEGFFNQQIEIKPINQSNEKCVKMYKRKKKKTLLGRIARMLLDIETVSKADATASGETFVLFILADGKEVYVDQDGFATLDEEQAPAGEHKLADGNTLIVDEEGQFVETSESTDKNTEPQDAVAPQTMRRTKYKFSDANNGDALKSKIAEMQSTIDQLSQSLADAQELLESTKGEVEEMRRKTPSIQPAAQRMSFKGNAEKMSTAERMAVALNQTLQRKGR